MYYVKGKLEIVQISESTYQVWAKPKPNRKAILVASNLNEDDAKELVRRWNAFEEGGIVDELRLACEETQKLFAFIAENYKSAPHFPAAERMVEAALAKC